MTENLTGKFGGIEQQLLQQHNAMMAALTGIGNKLDAIATALGAPPPTAVVTLEDVFNELKDIHLDTVSIDQKLAQLKLGLINPDPLSSPSVQNRIGLLVARWEQAIGQIGTHSSYPILQLMLETREGIEALINAIGTPTGDATTTALGILAAIRNCGCFGLPSAPNTQLCGNDAFASIGEGRITEYVPAPVGQPGIAILHKAAIWPSDGPTGITVTHNIDIGPEKVILTSQNWGLWRVWVESTSPSYSDEWPPSAYYAVGQWRTLSGMGDKVFTTFSDKTIEVTLCPVDGNGNGGNEPQCWTIESQSVAVDPAYGFSPRQHAIVPLQPLTNYISWTNGEATTTPAAIMQGDYYGYQVKWVSGSCRVVYGVQGGVIHGHFIHSAADNFYIPEGYDYFLVDDSTGIENQPGFGPFVVEVCEPQEV